MPADDRIIEASEYAKAGGSSVPVKKAVTGTTANQLLPHGLYEMYGTVAIYWRAGLVGVVATSDDHELQAYERRLFVSRTGQDYVAVLRQGLTSGYVKFELVE